MRWASTESFLATATRAHHAAASDNMITVKPKARTCIRMQRQQASRFIGKERPRSSLGDRTFEQQAIRWPVPLEESTLMAPPPYSGDQLYECTNLFL